MTKLIELCNTQGKRILMEMFENGKKVAEQDISDWVHQQVKELIELQRMQGRTWTYKTINLKNNGR